MMRKRCSRPAALIAASIFSLAAALAGAATSMRGKVTDASGAPLADVTVTLTNGIRGTSYAAKTGQDGAYVLPDVAPAEYQLTFEKAGYATIRGTVSVVRRKGNVFDAVLNKSAGSAKPAPPPWQEENLRAHELYEQGKYAEAQALYREILAADPKVAFVHYDVGNCAYHLRDFEGAVKSYREALRLNPDFAEAYTNLANAYIRLKKYDEAIPFYEAAVRSSAATGALFYGLGVLYLNSGQPAKAAPCLEKFVSLEPKSGSGYLLLGAACADAGDPARAVDAYGKALGLITDEREAERVRGLIEDLKARIKK